MHANELPELIQALLRPQSHAYPATGLRLLETHISWVILTGMYAYKIKKPLDLGFLDFSTLERRKHCCEEELRLNRRLAPNLYLEIVRITGQPEKPQLGGPGEAFEYAVKMLEFPQDALLGEVLARHALTLEHMDELAGLLARFHAQAEVAGEAQPFGTAERVHHPVAENFHQIRPLLQEPHDLEQLQRLEDWANATYAQLRPTLLERKSGGCVRECHGDLHLGNMALLDGRITPFDCIEFNENLRWIDVMNEVAFLVMDFDDRGIPEYGHRFLNAYLEHTGDYAGLALLPYYRAYRAMVRAKVALIRLGQPGMAPAERERVQRTYRGYAGLAETYARPAQPAMLLTHGVSGSGKTTASGRLLEQLGAVRIRSDVERKRLFGLAATARSGSPRAGGLYTRAGTEQTYQRLLELAERVVRSGFTVIVDATFLERAHRAQFRLLAQRLHTPFAILSCHAEPDTLRRWVSERQSKQQDASEAGTEVVEQQLQAQEPLDASEGPLAIRVDSAELMGGEALAIRVRRTLQGQV